MGATSASTPRPARARGSFSCCRGCERITRGSALGEIWQRSVEANGIRLHIAEQGEGPLVLLCHGFPESWYSWRHQLRALAEAGFRAVAPDMRGYGRSDRPSGVDQYTLFHLVGDMVGLLDALEAPSAVIAGHDWGAPVAWHAALLRPDRFRAVIALCVPFRPRGSRRPTSVMPRTGEAVFYQLYFQEPGVAEAELGRDVRRSLSLLYRTPRKEVAASATMVPRGGGWLAHMPEPAGLPKWLTAADLDFYVGEYERTGFAGGLNWYRNIDRNWELLAPWHHARIEVPALFIAGERDLVLAFPGSKEMVANMKRFVPQLRGSIILPECGHWTQQEKPAEVSAAMIDFVRETGGSPGIRG
jgi:pimeloyl-ACP methyl ester carboxylesterase